MVDRGLLLALMGSVLFICSGNYYRSRFAEIYFNHRAVESGMTLRAESRGFRLNPANVGPISKYTLRALEGFGLAAPQPHRDPQVLMISDLRQAAHIVAVKEAEHRPMMQRWFPDWVARTEFWHIHDLDCAVAAEALPELRRHVDALVRRFAGTAPVDA